MVNIKLNKQLYKDYYILSNFKANFSNYINTKKKIWFYIIYLDKYINFKKDLFKFVNFFFKKWNYYYLKDFLF